MKKQIERVRIEVVAAKNKQLSDIFKKLSRSIKQYDRQYFRKTEEEKDSSRNQYNLLIDQNLEELKGLNNIQNDLFKIKRKILLNNTTNSFQTSITEEIHKSEMRLTNKLRFNLNTRDSFENTGNIECSETKIQDTFSPNVVKSIEKRVKEVETRSVPQLKVKNFFVKKQNIKSVMTNKIKLKEIKKQLKKHPHSLTLDHFKTFYNVKKRYIDDLIVSPTKDIFQKQISTQRVYSKHVQKIDQLQRMGTQIQYVLSKCSNVLECHYKDLDNFDEVDRIKKTKRENVSGIYKSFEQQNIMKRISDQKHSKFKLKRIVSKRPTTNVFQQRS